MKILSVQLPLGVYPHGHLMDQDGCRTSSQHKYIPHGKEEAEEKGAPQTVYPLSNFYLDLTDQHTVS